MLVISVIYPRSEGADFDFDYYEQKHLPLVGAHWGKSGLLGAEAMRGVAAADGSDPPYLALALIRFSSMADFKAAMDGDGAKAILGDIPNFTSVSPIVQINEPLGAN